MKKVMVSVLWIMIGIILIGLAFAGKVDEFWNGMGSGLLIVGILQLIRFYRFQNNEAYRFQNNEAYREKVEIEQNDERNRFIRNKAWAWAGYMFVILVSILSIVFRIMGQELLAIASAYSVCLVLLLFWGSYIFLRKKY